MQQQQQTTQEQAGLYIISVAARLLSMHPQTLRKYERAGFLSPNRTGGMLRLYSSEDIARLSLIKHFVETVGLNLAGVDVGLELAQVLGQLQRDLDETKDPEELKKKVQEHIDAAVKAMRLSEVEPAIPSRATVTIRFK